MAQVELTKETDAVLHRFADAMGMSWEEAATYLLMRSIVDLLSSPGWADLRKPAKSKTR